jgi:branched-chain amino acid transport system substrate-binding protein
MIQKGGKKMRSKALSILVVLSMVMLLVAACGPTPEPQTIVETVVETVEVEKEVTVVETVEVEKEVTIVETVEVEVTAVPEATAPPDVECPETIKIGSVTDVTGPLASFGAYFRWAFDYFIEEKNADGGVYVAECDKKIPLEMLYGDHSADEQKAVTEMEYLVEQGVVVLTGSTAIMPLGQVVAEKNGIPLVVANGSLTEPFQQGFRYIFSTSWMNNEMATWPFMLAEYFGMENPVIGFMEEQNLMGIDYSSNLQAEALKRGYTDLVIQKYQRFGGDYSTQILAFKDAGVNFVYAPMIGPDGMTFWAQMKELDFNPDAALMLIAPADRASWLSFGDDANYVITTNDYHWATGYPGAAEFDAAYQADHDGDHATELAGDGYAALQIIVDAIERAGSLDADKLRDAIAATDMVTIKGPIAFYPNGMPIREYFAVQYLDGVETIIWPADMAETDPVFPFPAWTDPNR